MRRVGKMLLGPGVVGLVVAGVIAAPGSASPVANASACVKAKNIEAIVDDSGSMGITDPERLRIQALKLLMTDLSSSTTLGAVEFGGGFFGLAADTVFAPQPVTPPNAAAMLAALEQKIQDDNGATDYNAAFARSDADNPNATARIFLTDGGHNIGDYSEGHLVHRVPTYVIAFGSELKTSPTDRARLEKIAADTGTQLYLAESPGQLQPVMKKIGAALTCERSLKEFIDQLAQGQSKPHGVAVSAAARSIKITLTWASPLDKFKLSGLRVLGGGQTIAVASARRHKPSKLKVTTTTSKTFTVLKVSRLKKGKLRFAVKATKVGSGVPKATVTTQVTQSRRK